MLSARLIVLVLAVLVTLVNANEEAPKVKTPLGAIKGYYKLSEHGRQYEAYEGIPYALPPVGKLRFKPPHRLPSWNGELVATKFGSMCLQYTQMPMDPNELVEGAEDCLYLNVYVPVRDNNGARTPQMPVIFYIHGGAFQFGAGTMQGPKYLMDRDIVFVSINYRLGPLGFLSTEDEVVPGNMGLKDQNMALRWVSENIEWFGGDPKRITLVGLSAGGASVHYHYLSPLSAGLFHAGISVSGTTLNCWTQTENALEKAKKLADFMGCPTTTTKEMIHCLRFRPARTMVQAVGEFMHFHYNPFTPFGPVVEKTEDAYFINSSPAEIISSGQVHDIPWVTGVTSEEGIWPVAEFITKDESFKKLEENWDLLAPLFLDYNYTIPKEKHVEIGRLIKKHYFGNKPIDKTTQKELIKLAGDRFFVTDSEKAARLQAKVNEQPVWYYYYSYRSEDSLSDIMSGTKEVYGVSHGDDAFSVLNTDFMNPTKTERDRAMQQRLIDLWVTVATNGAPNVAGVEWPRLNPAEKELRFLHIAAPDKIFMDSNANLGEKKFWNTIDFNENKISRGSHQMRKEEL